MAALARPALFSLQRHPPSRRGLAAVLGVCAAAMLVGYLVKLPCASGDWGDGRQYERACYSDIVPLYVTEHLHEGKTPYLSADNEYPVLTGMTMWLAAQPASGFSSFFHWNALILTAAALATAALLYRVAGMRALLFAAAPTLVVYGFVNWDLVAVAFATAGTVALLAGRDAWAGGWLGLGAAAKLYPALLAAPFALHRMRARHYAGAARLAAGTAVAWAAANLPFAIVATDRWAHFFRFNSQRGADWDSLWFLFDRHVATLSTGAVNLWSLVAFVAAAAAVWFLKARRDPGFPAWAFGFPLVVVFLLTNKVYSPQYGLWLLPWFALALPDLRLFAAFQAADVAVFVTRFRFFFDTGSPPDVAGPEFAAFEAALLLRAAVLIVCVGAWVRRQTPATADLGTAPTLRALLRPARA